MTAFNINSRYKIVYRQNVDSDLNKDRVKVTFGYYVDHDGTFFIQKFESGKLHYINFKDIVSITEVDNDRSRQ